MILQTHQPSARTCNSASSNDRHSYYTFTTNPVDINKLDALTKGGKTIAEAIDILAKKDYAEMWTEDFNATQ
jgi:hypothetical protein